MDPQQKQKFFLFAGAIILMIIAIIATPFNPPSVPISLLPSPEISTSDNLVKDEIFTFADPSLWKITPAMESTTSSGGRIFSTGSSQITLSQRIALAPQTSGLRVALDSTTKNSSPIVIKLIADSGKALHTIVTSGTNAFYQDIALGEPVSSLTVQLILPENTQTTLNTLKITPLFSSQP
ncbi:MAG: hypothetical protein ACK4NC_00650 [Candidatus Gracilibacteria bacterium]